MSFGISWLVNKRLFCLNSFFSEENLRFWWNFVSFFLFFLGLSGLGGIARADPCRMDLWSGWFLRCVFGCGRFFLTLLFRAGCSCGHSSPAEGRGAIGIHKRKWFGAGLSTFFLAVLLQIFRTTFLFFKIFFSHNFFFTAKKWVFVFFVLDLRVWSTRDLIVIYCPHPSPCWPFLCCLFWFFAIFVPCEFDDVAYFPRGFFFQFLTAFIRTMGRSRHTLLFMILRVPRSPRRRWMCCGPRTAVNGALPMLKGEFFWPIENL